MKHNMRLNTVGLVLIVLVISAVGTLAAPASASTTTYSGSGNPRSILEGANTATSGSNPANDTVLQLGIPPGGWTGYQLGTTFTNIARNADFVANGQFTGSSNPWIFSESGDTNYLSNGFNTTTTGSTTGSDYIRLNGKESVSTPITNMNFTSGTGWTPNYYNRTGSSYATYTSQYVALNEWQESGTLSSSGNPRSGQDTVVADWNFTYSGSGQADFASLNYKFYISTWYQMGSGSMTVKLILTRFVGANPSFEIFNYPVSGTTTKPASPTSVNITSYLTAPGLYRIRLYAFVSLSIPQYSSATATVNWDDVGVYIKYGKFLSQSKAMWRQTFNFNQYAIADGKVTFKYYTNLTTMVPSTDSYVSVWVNGTSNNRYDLLAFSTVAMKTWGTLSVTIPYTALNQSAPLPTISLGIGLYIGTNLQIQSNSNPRFYFDNVTFYIKYKPTPAYIKLGLYDDAHPQWYVAAGSYGSGTLAISSTWSGTSAIFHFRYNGTNGRIGYNLTSTTFSYTSTMFASRWRYTNATTFTVHDDTVTNWYCNYSTPTSIGGYQNYNASVYIRTDWNSSSGLVTQVKFGGLAVTDYIIVKVNSSTSMIKIPASVFPDPPQYLLEILASSPNYLGPSTVRTLVYTQGNTTKNPGPGDWKNATYFIPKNMTRLVGALRNGTRGIPPNVGSFSVTIKLFNASNLVQPYTGKSWTRTPDHNGMFNVTLNAWSESNPNNVTYGPLSSATLWYFAVNWTNNYEAGNGIARLTTNRTISTVISTTLVSPSAPYSVPYGDGFTLSAQFRKASDNSNVSSATVTYKWSDQGGTSPMSESPANSGNYMDTIPGGQAHQHYGTNSINITATKPGFARQSILVQVTVRNVSTTGIAASFTVPYQTYPWNNTVQTSLTYTDVDHSGAGVTLATLYVNKTCANATNVGSSGIRWWYRYFGSGTYQIFFNATSSTPTGTRAWSFNVTASKPYYQQVSFGLNGFYLRDRLTSYSASFLSATTPWGDNATFLVTFRDSDSGGVPILGATATCTWTNSYTVMALGNGTYRFSLSVAGLSPQPVSFSFSFSKTHWVPISGISAQVTIRSIGTTLYSPTNTITMYWGDNQTAVLVYKDFDHNLNISSATWRRVLAYDTQTGANYTNSLIYSIYINSPSNSWTIRVNGSLPVGTYTLWIHVLVSTSNGYYVDQWLYPTLSIQAVPTSLTMQSMTVLTVVCNDTARIVVTYVDTVHGRAVLYAGVSMDIDQSIFWRAYENGSGIYTIFLYTNASTDRPQPYEFTVQLLEANYAASAALGNLFINPISTSLQVPAELIVVTYGDPLTFNVFFEDLNHTRGIVGATVRCNWTTSGSLGKFADDFGNGSYSFIFDSTLKGQGLFTIQIQASNLHYKTVSRSYSFIIGVVSTTLSLHGTPAAAPWGDNIIVLVDYNRTGTTNVQSPLTLTTNWTRSPVLSLTPAGQWQITLDTTGLPEGTYWIRIDFGKQHYQNQTITMSITIRAINVEMRFYQKPDKVPQGNVANITIQLWDVDHLQGVTGATLSVGLDQSLYTVTELGSGYYEIDVKTGSISAAKLSFTVDASKPHYSLSAEPGQVSFDIIAQGLPLPTVILIGGGSGGGVILVVLAYMMYRKRKIPFVIKKIDQSINLIGKGEVPQAVPMRTRTQLIDGIYHTKLAILSKEKLEEPGKKKEKGAKKPAVVSEMKTRETLAATHEEVSVKGTPEVELKTLEAPARTEAEEADVALIAEELEKLETKGGTESIRETDLIKREMEELEKEAKKKKKKSD